MLTLGQFIKELRGERTQDDVARAYHGDPSMISFAESDKKIRFSSLRKICKQGLKLSDTDWETVKLLWLEQQSGEPVFTKSAASARKALQLKEATANQDFLEKLESRVLRNMTTISKNQLQATILTIFDNPNLMKALKQFYEVFRSFEPKSKDH